MGLFKIGPREPTQVDLGRWFDAAEKSKSPRNREEIRREVWSRNPVRWRRLQRDYRWAQKQMKKLGYNPDDARWIL